MAHRSRPLRPKIEAGFSRYGDLVRRAERRVRPNIQGRCPKTLKTVGPREVVSEPTKKAFRALLQSEGPIHFVVRAWDGLADGSGAPKAIASRQNVQKQPWLFGPPAGALFSGR